jgi:hypothetical protein
VIFGVNVCYLFSHYSLTPCSTRASLCLTALYAENMMTGKLAEQIQRLPKLRRNELVSIWNDNFQTLPPKTLRKELMVSLLSYRIQERLHGGLSLQARRRLKQIASGLPKGPRSTRQAVAPQEGTRILRQWRGEMYEVRCTDDGLFYRGERYSSLSKIAFVITGTKWSGPAFFGVKK